MDQDATGHAGRPRPWPNCVRWGHSCPSSKGAQPPQFSAHICCGQMAGWIKMPLGMEVGLGPGDFVLDGDVAPLPKKGAEPPTANFQPMSIVAKRLDGSIWYLAWRWALVQTQKGGRAPPIFGPFLLLPNGCMYQDTTWYRGGPQPRRHCVRWDPPRTPVKGHFPQFLANSVVAKRLDVLRCHLVLR